MSESRGEIQIAAVARVGAWIISLAVIAVGIWFTAAQTLTIEQSVPDEPQYRLMDVSGIGLALLCVGIITLMAVLLSEAYISPAER